MSVTIIRVKITAAQQPKVEATPVFTDRWTDKQNMVHPHNGILCSLKKEGHLTPAMTWMNLEVIMLSDVSQSQKDKYYLIHLHEVPGGARFIGTDSRTVGARGWGRGWEGVFHGDASV